MTDWTVRLLSNQDLGIALALLDERPYENVFVTSRVRAGGLERFGLGCDMFGYEEDGKLCALLHVGSNLVPVNATPHALEAFTQLLGPERRCASIVGRADEALGLYERLSSRWPDVWGSPRQVRDNQPLLVISGDPTVPADERVRPITHDWFEEYFSAAVAMYTEEVGVSPLDGGNGYRWYVGRLIDQGRAFGVVADSQVVFKSDVGSATNDVCQVAGVWLRPDLRGQGLSAGAMAQVVRLCQQQWQHVTLYVNDYNHVARGLYAKIGFEQHSTMATVLY